MPAKVDQVRMMILVPLLGLFLLPIPNWGQQEYPYSLAELNLIVPASRSQVQLEELLFLITVAAPAYPEFLRSPQAISEQGNPRMSDILYAHKIYPDVWKQKGLVDIGYDPNLVATVPIVLQNQTGQVLQYEVALSVGYFAQRPSQSGLMLSSVTEIPITFRCFSAAKHFPMAVIIQLRWEGGSGSMEMGKRKTFVRPITLEGLTLAITPELLNSH